MTTNDRIKYQPPKNLDQYFKNDIVIEILEQGSDQATDKQLSIKADEKSWLLGEKRNHETLGIKSGDNNDALQKKVKYSTLDKYLDVKKPQKFYWMSMGKTTTMRLMIYLTLSEMANLSSVCHYFRLCYRELWQHSDLF